MNWWSNKDAAPFTAEFVRKAFEKMSSPEYQERVMDKTRQRMGSEALLNKALDLGRISEDEYWHYMTTVAINGMLIVHPDMAYKFEGIEL